MMCGVDFTYTYMQCDTRNMNEGVQVVMKKEYLKRQNKMDSYSNSKEPCSYDSKDFQKHKLDFRADDWPFVTTPISDKLPGSPNMPEWCCIPFEFWCRNINSYQNDMDIIALLNLITLILPHIILIDLNFLETIFLHNFDDDEEEEEFDLVDY